MSDVPERWRHTEHTQEPEVRYTISPDLMGNILIRLSAVEKSTNANTDAIAATKATSIGVDIQDLRDKVEQHDLSIVSLQGARYDTKKRVDDLLDKTGNHDSELRSLRRKTTILELAIDGLAMRPQHVGTLPTPPMYSTEGKS